MKGHSITSRLLVDSHNLLNTTTTAQMADNDSSRQERAKRRSRTEQEAKLKAGAGSRRTTTPGVSSVSNEGSRRSRTEQEAKLKAGAGSRRTTTPGASSVTNEDTIADIESRNNNRRSQRTANGDREAKRRAATGRSSRVGASSVASSSSSRATRKSRESRAGENRGGDSRAEARERKLREAGLGVDSSQSKEEESSDPRVATKNLSEATALGAVSTAAVAGKDDDGIHLEAVLVDEDTDANNVRRSMEAENQRLKTEMAIENERLRQKMLQDNARLQEEMEETRTGSAPPSTDDNEAAQKKKRCRMIWIFVIIILVGGGVGAYFATAGTSSESESVVSNDSSSGAPSMPPTNTTETPSAPEVTAPPSRETPLFDPPSEEDCAAIANGESIQGQEDSTMVIKSFDVVMDISLATDTNINVLLPDVQSKIQENLMTSLAGCSETTGNIRHRHLQLYKYIVLNGNVTSLEQFEGIDCVDGATEPCFRVVARMDLYLQGEIAQFRLLGKVIDEYSARDDEPSFSLVQKLELGRPFLEIAIQAVLSNDPTEQPSPAPSTTPSLFPSKQPTNAPTKKPTQVPTTGAPTPVPTLAPTPIPSKSPTKQPSARPINTGNECFKGSCVGEDACSGFDIEEFFVGCGSCLAPRSCLNAAADIGDNSCNNDGCEGASGFIGDNSCTGDNACKEVDDVEIGRDSCNCEDCCRCIEPGDEIPPGSCNRLADSSDDVDYAPFDNFGDGPLTTCCRAPNSSGGGGGGGGGGPS